MILILGIDPGQHGGYCLMSLDGNKKSVKAFNKLTLPEISKDIGDLKNCASLLGDRVIAYIEEVHSMPNNGKVQAFSFGKNYGFWIGILIAHGIEIRETLPAKWQSALKLRVRGLEYGEKKKALKEIAQKRFPELNLTLDTCDAALIAEYGRRCLLYEIHNP